MSDEIRIRDADTAAQRRWRRRGYDWTHSATRYRFDRWNCPEHPDEPL